MTTVALALALATQAFDLPPGLLSAICYTETKHAPSSINRDDGAPGSDSIGLCQVKPTTARWLGFKGKDSDLLKPKVNAHYAAKYLRYQLNRYDGDIIKSVAAYNAGAHRINNKGLIKNRKYVRRVLIAWEESR